ncbi:MAG: PaaI family thioesterase [archaeon]|nr:PaaI family thioesterase [archaeon]
MSEEIGKIEERSKRMIQLFNSAKGMEVKKLPVPPLTKWLNPTIIDAKYGEIEVRYIIRPEMANPTGLLHGGIQCTMLDDIMGMTSTTLGLKGFLISIDLHIDYLGKAKVGEEVFAKGKIIREGKNIVHAEGQLFNKERKLIAIASSNLLKTQYVADYTKNLEKNE